MSLSLLHPEIRPVSVVLHPEVRPVSAFVVHLLPEICGLAWAPTLAQVRGTERGT